MGNGKDATGISTGAQIAGSQVLGKVGGSLLSKTFLGLNPIGWLALGYGAFSVLRGTNEKKADRVGTSRSKTSLRYGIAPAQHILGECADEGVLVYACQGPATSDNNLNGNTLHLVIALQVGNADSITGVSVNKTMSDLEVETGYTRAWSNARKAMKPTRTVPAGLRRTRIIPYLDTRDSNGNLITDRGSSIRHAYTQSLAWVRARNAAREQGDPAIAEPLEWTVRHRLDGIAYIHVELTNTAAGEWQKFPDDLEFRIRGVKPNFPTSANALNPTDAAEFGYSGPEWTDNAAALMYWYLTEIRHVHPSRIDTESFLRAFDICEQIYTVEYGTSPASWVPATTRSSVSTGSTGRSSTRTIRFASSGNSGLRWPGDSFTRTEPSTSTRARSRSRRASSPRICASKWWKIRWAPGLPGMSSAFG